MKYVSITFTPDLTLFDDYIKYLEGNKRPVDVIRRKSWQIFLWANQIDINTALIFRATVVYL